MLFGINFEPVLPAITAVSIALGIVVGLLGLFQDRHTKNGKLTRSGWGILALMISLGLLTFFSGLADKRINDEKERRQEEERTGQFRSQMGELKGVTGRLDRVTGSLGQLQDGMQQSLESQRELFGVADQNLRASTALQEQTQANTLQVLRRVFEEGNRLSAERIAISVTYLCPFTGELAVDSPEFESATIAVSSPGRSDVSIATRQKVDLDSGVVFHSFVGDLGPYDEFSVWRNAQVTIRLQAGRIGRPFTLDELQTYEEFVARRGGQEPSPPVCPTTIGLLLNGRQVLTAAGELRPLNRHDFTVEFENLRIDSRRLPRLTN